mgnify:CR=1 FL=1|tara:strand:+ start:44203 stop:44382 length:180 start_codon:yes stop_codon:yes gene_type:complete
MIHRIAIEVSEEFEADYAYVLNLLRSGIDEEQVRRMCSIMKKSGTNVPRSHHEYETEEP